MIRNGLYYYSVFSKISITETDKYKIQKLHRSVSLGIFVVLGTIVASGVNVYIVE